MSILLALGAGCFGFCYRASFGIMFGRPARMADVPVFGIGAIVLIMSHLTTIEAYALRTSSGSMTHVLANLANLELLFPCTVGGVMSHLGADLASDELLFPCAVLSQMTGLGANVALDSAQITPVRSSIEKNGWTSSQFVHGPSSNHCSLTSPKST